MSPSHSAYAGYQQSPPPTQPRPNLRSATPEQSDLYEFPWYHGAIPRDEAIRRLESMGGFDGLFLVRDSTTVANSFVLTMFAKGVSKNFQIMLMDNPGGIPMYRIDDGPHFPRIDQLLQHYTTNPDRLPCRLTDYCPRPPTRTTEC